MEHELKGDLSWEWLEVIWGGELGDQFASVCNIDLLFQQSWTQVEVETSLKVFLDEVLVHGNLPERFELLR